MKKLRFFLSLAIILLLASGCVQPPAISPDYDFSELRKIGVLHFTSYGNQPSSGEVITNQFTIELLRRNYEVIERSRLRAILRERKLLVKEKLTAEEIRTIGTALEVDALLTGAVIRYSPSQRKVVYFDPEKESEEIINELRLDPNVFIIAEGANYVSYLTQAQVGVSARLIDVDTAQVVWATSAEYTAFSLEEAIRWTVSELLSQLPQD